MAFKVLNGANRSELESHFFLVEAANPQRIGEVAGRLELHADATAVGLRLEDLPAEELGRGRQGDFAVNGLPERVVGIGHVRTHRLGLIRTSLDVKSAVPPAYTPDSNLNPLRWGVGLVEPSGIEPPTSALRTRRSPN